MRVGQSSPVEVNWAGRRQPQFQHPKLFDPKINATRMAGQHTFKAGFEYQWLSVRTLDVNPTLGRDVYSGLFSAPSVG